MNMPNSQDMILGEMRGQLREMVHSMNNMSAKLDGLSREVIGLGPLAADIVDLKGRVTAIEVLINRSEGAKGMGAALLKSPALAWIVSAAITAWAVISGKLG